MDVWECFPLEGEMKMGEARKRICFYEVVIE